MIQLGSQGAEVTAWQQFLANSEEFDITVDGVFGKGTHEATVKFQKFVEIGADGIVGKGTYGIAKERGYDGGYTA